MDEVMDLVIFLDANVLAKPATRSMVLFASNASNYAVTWSAYVEQEADRHLRSGQTPVSQVRQTAHLELSPTGAETTYPHTDSSDQQVLADAVKARAQFIITENVQDFGIEDLVATKITAVNPDLFLAERVTDAGYTEALNRMAALMTHPPRTPEELHTALGRQHPRTVDAHRACFTAHPMSATHHPPATLYRGERCLRCLRIDPPLTIGVCLDCLNRQFHANT